MINDLTFTGERVVPNRTCHAQTMAEHLIRYAFATKYAKVGRILDVACGTGYGLKVMGWLGAEKFGADIDKESVDFSKEFNQSDFFHTINFERQSLTAYFTVGKFELITSFETIEHLDDPNLFLQGIKRG
jgi:2-polyprenyl-3-methyl-5-hydroxy-6-metoxy-1,4-benzoquinol methylase